MAADPGGAGKTVPAAQPSRNQSDPRRFTPAPSPKPQGPLEHPHPVLQAAGFSGGIEAFNQKVAQIANAHQKAYGLLPSPGLTLDVAKRDVQPDHYPALF